jgi:hypothetical protein
VIVILMSLLSSCSKSKISYSEAFENKSDFDILLVMEFGDVGIDSSKFDTVVLSKNEERIEHFLFGGDSFDDLDDCGHTTEWVRLFVKDNDSLIVDIQLSNSESWNFNILKDEKYGNREAECRVVVSNSDIK